MMVATVSIRRDYHQMKRELLGRRKDGQDSHGLQSFLAVSTLPKITADQRLSVACPILTEGVWPWDKGDL